jgi:CAAX protease family protein
VTVTAEHRTTARTHSVRPVQIKQYSLRGILGVWAAAALPMAALAWLGAPWLAHTLDGPNALTRALILSLTAGMVWQFVLVVGLVYREQRTLRWSVVKDALWLHAPRRPKTGRRGGRLWWMVVPLIFLAAAEEMLPKLPTPGARDLALFLDSDAGHSFMSGNWLWFAICIVMFVFNTVLGEELLFRGVLLPRMQGVFGRKDWVANGVLFALYHLHVPWVIPQTFVDLFISAGPAKRYRSSLIAIAAHSAQTVFFTVIALVLVLR